MKILNFCPVCTASTIKPYSFTIESERAGAIHYSQSYCPKCDLVFSNPVAAPEELESFYSSHYYEEVEVFYNTKQPGIENKIRDRAKDEAEGLKKSVLPYVNKGLFFEIGAGFGALLEGAKQLGFEVAGIEPSKEAVSLGREVFGLKDLRQGIFNSSDWPEAFCDVIYSYHVIEHVCDPVNFVRGIKRMLKPGGVVVIGTENHHNSWVIYRKVRSWLKGRRRPEFQTADHHTYYFSDRSLGFLLKKEGFGIIRSLVYTQSLKEKLAKAHFRSIFSKIFFYLLHYSDVLTRKGNRLLVWCKKPI